MPDFTELNPRFIFWMIIILVLGGMFLVSLLPIQPKTEENKTIIITKTEYVKILITPTPDGITYYPNEYQSGLRKINRPFSWMRSDVSGLKDMKVTAKVYNYLTFDKLHRFNPTDYKYYEMPPTAQDSKFLLIFFTIYVDDVIGDDIRLWLPTKDMFAVQIRNTMYSPIDYPEQLRFKELEETFNDNDNGRVKAYGQYPTYTDKSYANATAGEISVKEYYLMGGKSNAQDGYIIFEIPKNTPVNEIMFRASFFTFGDSSWKLTD